MIHSSRLGKCNFDPLDWANFAGPAANFAASQTIICLAHRPLGSAFHPRRKSVRSPYARERRSPHTRTRERISLGTRDRVEPRARAIIERHHRIDPRRSTPHEDTLLVKKLACHLPTSRDSSFVCCLTQA